MIGGIVNASPGMTGQWAPGQAPLCRPLGPGERGEFFARGVRGIFRLPWTSPGLQGRGLPCRGPRVIHLLGA